MCIPMYYMYFIYIYETLKKKKSSVVEAQTIVYSEQNVGCIIISESYQLQSYFTFCHFGG